MSLKKLLILILTASSTVLLCGCPTVTGAPDFKWSPQIWLGDSGSKSIVRRSGGSTVTMFCEDDRFDKMVCMHNSEIGKAKKAAYDVINACDQWKPGATAQDALNTLEEIERNFY